jgi:hypothetical protein
MQLYVSGVQMRNGQANSSQSDDEYMSERLVRGGMRDDVLAYLLRLYLPNLNYCTITSASVFQEFMKHMLVRG